MFTSGARIVNAYMHQIFFLHPPIDTMLFCLDFIEIQILLTTPQMLETGTKATSTSHKTSSLPGTQLAKFLTGPVQKLTKKTQTLY